MSTPPPQKRQKQSSTTTSPNTANREGLLPQTPLAPKPAVDPLQPPPSTSTNPRKRRASHSPKLNTLPPGTTLPVESSPNVSISALLTDEKGRKKGRTNTPWTPQEEQRLKQMRDAGHGWSEIAKAFPARTEGSVKKHWYKDMHYAEFGEDDSNALRDAIREYEANKWKMIGQKLGKPAKACEQYAKEHFKNA